tara:strand:- start:564 stop:794 length:231 start_codon:yes stop_codon:yes gene_type:complete
MNSSKKIKLNIDNDVLRRLRSDLGIKMMGGNFAGTSDSFIKKLIDKIDNGAEEWHCCFKNKEKGASNGKKRKTTNQ